MAPERIAIPELHARLMAQGVSARKHVAVVCPVCKTVQSIQSFHCAGIAEAEANRLIGFSCVGRVTNAGPHRRGTPPGKGCDWTLGGLFRIHDLEVVDEEGKVHPHFVVATPEEAVALERRHALAINEGRAA